MKRSCNSDELITTAMRPLPATPSVVKASGRGREQLLCSSSTTPKRPPGAAERRWGRRGSSTAAQRWADGWLLLLRRVCTAAEGHRRGRWGGWFRRVARGVVARGIIGNVHSSL